MKRSPKTRLIAAIPATLAAPSFVIAMVACAGTVEAPPGTTLGGGGTGGGDVVTGTAIDRRYLHGIVVSDPVDLTASSIRALVQQGGSWQTLPGVGHADGSFEVAGVPHGPYVLALDDVYLYTSARVIDFGRRLVGRRDATHMAVIAATIDNLEPWEQSDQIRWSSADSQGFGNWLFDAQPLPGDTALSGQTTKWGGGLVQSSQGDVLYGVQTSARASSKGSSYQAITRFASFMDVDMKADETTSVQGTFATVADGQSLNVDFRGQEFLALTGAVSPSAEWRWSNLHVSATPGGVLGDLSCGGFLATMSLDDLDTDHGSISWGNPFPTQWKPMALLEVDWTTEVLAPGATSSFAVWSNMIVWAPPEELGAGPMRPVLSPVQNPRVNGSSAFSPQNGITTTPTLSWDPPAIGTPAGYSVEVNHVYASESATKIDPGPYLVTTGTTLALPPGVLEPGEAYVFVLRVFGGDVDFGTQPFGWNDEHAMTGALTALMTP